MKPLHLYFYCSTAQREILFLKLLVAAIVRDGRRLSHRVTLNEVNIMAKFGKGDLYDKANKKSVQHSLLVFVPKNGAYHKKDKQGKLTDEVGGYFATVMIDQSLFNPDKVKSGETKLMHNGKEDQGSMKGKVQVNPYFSNYVKKIDASRSQTGKDRMITRHDTPYTLSQINALAAAANNVP